MSDKPKWAVYAEGAGKVIGLVAIINGALIILTDADTPLGGFSRILISPFVETYNECVEKVDHSAEGIRECRLEHGLQL